VEYAQLALREAPTVYFEGIPQLFLASCLCSTGQLDQGLPVLEAIVPIAEAWEHRMIWMFSASVLAEAYGSSGRVDDARELAERVLSWAERGGADYLTARAHRMLGVLEAASGRPAVAIAHLDRAIEVAGRTGSENELPWRSASAVGCYAASRAAPTSSVHSRSSPASERASSRSAFEPNSLPPPRRGRASSSTHPPSTSAVPRCPPN
jgi:hypothetical protein